VANATAWLVACRQTTKLKEYKITQQWLIIVIVVITGRRGSLVSIVSDYGLDDRAIQVRSPAVAEYFSSNLCVQSGSGAHPVSYPMGTGVLSPRQLRDSDHSPHLVLRSLMSRSYISS
jgi:hypothetical protein